jgi:cell division septal protein FtsQ
MRRNFRRKLRRLKSGYRSKKKSFFLFRKFFLISLAVVSVIGGSLYFFLFSSYFEIKEIRVTSSSGDLVLPITEIKNTIRDSVESNGILGKAKSIFLANLKKGDKTLKEKFPSIANVVLSRSFPNVLAAQIEERKPVAIFCKNEECFLIDSMGVIFQRTDKNCQDKFFIESIIYSGPLDLGRRVVEEENMSQILEITKKIEKNNISVLTAEIASEKRINTQTDEGWSIYFNSQKDIDIQLSDLSLLLKEKIPQEKRKDLKYIDLRFEKIYIYPEILK